MRYGKAPGDEEKDHAKEQRSGQADHEAWSEDRDGAQDCGEHEPIGDEKAPPEEAQGHRDLRPVGHRRYPSVNSAAGTCQERR